MKSIIPINFSDRYTTTGDFLPDFDENCDLLTVTIDNKLYMVKPADFGGLIRNVRMMSMTPPWNAYANYYKNGRPVYTNSQLVLDIDINNLDPIIFTNITHNKKIFDNEETYQAELSKVKKANFVKYVRPNNPWGKVHYSSYFINYPTNAYFLHKKAYIPLTFAEQDYWNLKLKNYSPSDYYTNNGKDLFENDIKNKTISYNGCEFYFDYSEDDENLISGSNTKNEHLFLSPVRIYYRLEMEDCEHRFDAKAWELFYGKPTDIYVESEQKNNKYILEWYDW
ncbi:hypothetical protein [Cellulophaga algicola]|nr:hypothetical protein [Cellulophaga algicola]